MVDDNTDAHTAPLSGVRVVDLSRLVAGNVVSHMLADFGADVIKIERPGAGDDLRNWREEGVEIFWKAYSRNKRSVCWNLKRDQDRAKLLQLVQTAHVFIENFVPGKLEEFGLGPDALLEANPKLIIVRVSGWGQTGPYRERPGFGTLIEGMSGYAHLNGFPDKPPALPPLATADMIAGLYGAYAVMLALRHVEVQGGRGQVIDLSLFDSMFSFVASEAVKYRVSGQVSMRAGNQAQHTAPRNVYRCADGRFIALSASMQGMYERLMSAIGRRELIDDPRFRTNEDRVQHRDALDAIIQEFMARRSLDENLRFFEEAGVTVGPVLAMDDLLRHPYMEGRQVVTEFGDPDVGTIPAHTPVPRLSRTPGKLNTPAPALGAHTEESEAELVHGGTDGHE
jgi:crotonobetainyl-CoA:carnitine CoA-transferase CaiB-like acyl-CoA transferase